MNTNALKSFAQAARNKLKEQIAAKLIYLLEESTDTSELRGKQSTRSKVRDLCSDLGQEVLVDRVAYTWFNRFVALRYMDVNGYQPFHVMVVTPKEGDIIPEIISNAKAADISDELLTFTEKDELLHILDTSSGNPENEAYRILLVAACNYLNKLFPFLFEAIDDYTELLLPNDLTSPHSIIADVVKGMNKEDCSNVEIIGWLYQFYISERKDEVSGAKGKVEKEDIPAVTQLFTPRWIVEYMVQNTLGKLWLQNYPDSNLREVMPYYIETECEDDFLPINSPEELTLVDPACGSGHILVYAFELLTYIYEEEGYRQRDIAQLILEKNLYGYEIDERAGQLAGLALYLKARAYDGGFFRRECNSPHIWVYKDFELDVEDVSQLFDELKFKPSNELYTDLDWMKEATNLGSLYQPVTQKKELTELLKVIQQSKQNTLFNTVDDLSKLQFSIRQLLVLQRTYCTLVANPPYLGGRDFNKRLKEYTGSTYADSKSDLCTCFIERGLVFIDNNSCLGMITQQSWMFLRSYEKLREKLVENNHINNLLHLGSRVFPEIGGEVVQNCTFVLCKNRVENSGVYIRLIDYSHTDIKAKKTLEAIQNPNCGWFYTTNQSNFKNIPGCNIGYWVSDGILEVFKNTPLLSENYDVRAGITTGNNTEFVRSWAEVDFPKIEFQADTFEKSLSVNKKWTPYNKGGSARKWYGNLELIIKFDDISKNKLNNQGNHLPSKKYYFKESVSWGLITSSTPSFRYYPKGFLFDVAGMSIFGFNEEQKHGLLAALNTKLYNNIGKIINPTLNLQAGNVANFPYNDIECESINKNVQQNISISKIEWDSRETSWDFQQNELVRQGKENLKEAYEAYEVYWTEQFHILHRNEEELNREFIAIYGLEEELTPEVPIEQITILKDEALITDGRLTFNLKEVMKQLVSYGVGCIMGRYSLDKEGLILASQGETIADYYNKVGLTEELVKLQPVADGIVPVLEEESFENDVVKQFETFMEQSFGTEHLHSNLNFLQRGLGRSTLRDYFVRDFYKDHTQRYQNRPIYWMLSSPKGAFRVLIYLHRYTPDTLNEVLNNYLHPYIQRIENEIELQETNLPSTSGANRTATIKRIDELKVKLEDCVIYSKELYDLAVERINLDLDDGVLVNYNKLGNAVEMVREINGKTKKASVRKFEWIKADEIR